MRNESATQQNRKRAERYSFSGDSSVESGFVINPENSSISIITDDFEPSISSETTGDTPMGNIIGRFNMFKKVCVPSLSRLLSADNCVPCSLFSFCVICAHTFFHGFIIDAGSPKLRLPKEIREYPMHLPRQTVTCLLTTL